MLSEINWSAIWVWCVAIYIFNFMLKLAKQHPEKSVKTASYLWSLFRK